jgi:hypothetical protein
VTYGNPSALLADALATFPQHRERFEADFAHFCSYSGLEQPRLPRGEPAVSDCVRYIADRTRFSWARWAFWSAGDYNGTTS